MSKKKGIVNDLPDRGVIVPHRFGDSQKVLKVSIPLTNERVQVLEEIIKVRGDDYRDYVEKALNDQMDNDLETPNDLGLDYCKHLKKILSSELNHGV
jgi:hypothetical protein